MRYYVLAGLLVLGACGRDSLTRPTNEQTPVAQTVASVDRAPDLKAPVDTTSDPSYFAEWRGCNLRIYAKHAPDRTFAVNIWKVVGPSWTNQVHVDYKGTVNAKKPYADNDLCWIKDEFPCWVQVDIGGILTYHHFNKGNFCPVPQPTPTPEPSPTPTPEPTPTPQPTPSPDPTPTPEPSPTPSPEPTPTPEPSYCYYEVDCGNQVSALAKQTCKSEQKEQLCNAQGGQWAKWQGGKEHCRIAFPGVSLDNFQLTPGQSADGCLNKRDN